MIDASNVICYAVLHAQDGIQPHSEHNMHTKLSQAELDDVERYLCEDSLATGVGDDMSTYDQDIIAWAAEQAQLLRDRQFGSLDIAHLADEIEAVAARERSEFAGRVAALLANMLSWPARQRGPGMQRAIAEQRNAIQRRLTRVPSLHGVLADPDWRAEIWSDAVIAATTATGRADWPARCPWSIGAAITTGWLPG